MSRSSRVMVPVVFSLATALIAILQSPENCRADGLGIIVPAYFYPGTGGPGGVGDGWATMAAAAAKVPITAVFNPDSGPLPGPADPNYVAALSNLDNAGGKTVAYVYTGNGTVPLATVESQASTYLTQYGGLIDGFYLDGMNLTPSTLSYYQSIDGYIRGLNPSYAVVGNPGQPFLNGLAPADYLSAADTFDIFEGPDTAPAGQVGFNNYPYGQNWFQSFASSRFDNTIYDVPTISAMLADLLKAAQLNAGNVYVTDQMGSNPYSQLPSYWDQEVAAIPSLPEPGAMVMVVGGMIILNARGRGRAA